MSRFLPHRSRLELLVLEDRLLPGNALGGVVQGFSPGDSTPARRAPASGDVPGAVALKLLALTAAAPAPTSGHDARLVVGAQVRSAVSGSAAPATSQRVVGTGALGTSDPLSAWNGVDDPLANPLPDPGGHPASTPGYRFHIQAGEGLPGASDQVESAPGSAGPGSGRAPEPGSAPAFTPVHPGGFDPLTLAVLALPGGGGGSHGSPPPQGNLLPPDIVAGCGGSCGCGCNTAGLLGTASGADGGNPASLMFSSAGVRYFDGQPKLETPDLQSSGFGIPWGQTRSWAGDPRYTPVNSTGLSAGVGWIVTQLPFLVQSSDPRTLVVVTSGTNDIFFDQTSPMTYAPHFFYQDQLRQDPQRPGILTLYDSTGNQFVFADFVTGPPLLRGRLLGVLDMFGNPTSLQWNPGNGQLMMVQRTDPATGASERYEYNYIQDPHDPNAGLVQNVRLVHHINGQPDQVVRQVVYAYYNTGEANGNQHDLKTATVEDGAGNALDTSYYRYWPRQINANGLVFDGLKYVFNPQSDARLVAAVGNPFNATDQQVAPFADDFYQYDNQGRVVQATAQAQGTFTYSYTSSPNPVGANSWAVETTETLPDHNQNLVFTNAYGEVMLQVFHDSGSNLQWDTSYRYDDQGRLIQVANPSAVTGYDPRYPDLLNRNPQTGHYQFLQDSAGLIQATDYYPLNAPIAPGYYQDTRLQDGQLGSAILQRSVAYTSHTASPANGGGTIYPMAAATAYRNSDGSGSETTSYRYDAWFSNAAGLTNGIISKTVSQPLISAAQNGPGSPDSTTSQFDSYGRMVLQTDPDGFVTTYRYDVLTGAVTSMVQDAGGTGHLNLTTTMVLDALGRTTLLRDPNGNLTYTVYDDPNHEVRIYTGWNLSTHTLTGPTQVVREDRGHSPSYTETLTMTAPIRPADLNTDGSPKGTEPISNLQTLARTFTSPNGQVIEDDAYFDLSNRPYTTAPYLGVAGQVQPDGTLTGNYWPTLYGYDVRGRQNQVVSPTGTLTQTDYDGLSRMIDTQIGTSPANLVVVSQYVYDNGGIGDGNLTAHIEYPTPSTPANPNPVDQRVTENFYDWRDHLVASKAGVQADENDGTHRPITYTEYDNLSEAVTQERYDGDGITVTIGSNGVPVKPPANLLRARSTMEYDDQGRVFRTHTFSVDQTNGRVSAASLTTNRWYDHRGNLIASAVPGGLVTKTHYDGAGRPDLTATTDGAGGPSWSAADSVANDHVLSQTETTYDNEGNVILVATRDRFHDETATGALNNPSLSPRARVSYVASYYDAANRLVAAVDVGTNGGTAYNRPTTPPSRSDTVLVTNQTYDAAGWVQDVTDPRGIVTRTLYDNLGRKTKTIAAFTGGPETNSTDVPTDYTYDGANHLLTVTAELPNNVPETTQHVYGVTTDSGSALNSNDLLAATIYPDTGTGQLNTESYTYDALGELATKMERNFNSSLNLSQTHAYTYDVLGRQTSDAVTVLGDGVDGSVLRLDMAYDTGGRPYLYTSYADTDGTTVVNQFQQVYNGLGQLITEYQSHYGPVDPTSTPSVQYAYSEMAGGANHSRLVSMTYPDGRVIHYGYNAGLDDTINRLSFLADDDGAGGVGQVLESYLYLGLDKVVERDHPEAGVNLTYIAQPGDPPTGDAGDRYVGLDRFGRIVDQNWYSPSAGQSTDRFQYGYDRDGNRVYQANLVTEALQLPGGFDELYQYNALNRLTDFARGTLNATHDDLVGPASHTQDWNLDAVGNWNTLTTDGTTQSRDHNPQNQVTDVNGTPLAYDNNGNTTTDENGQTYVYDAWNRPVQVQDINGNPLAAYAFDALGRRILETNLLTGMTTDLYFSSAWQVVEEQVGGGTQAQYVWSPVYVDALVERDTATGPRLYAQQDANWNVTAVVDTTGTVQERYVYDPYGQATVLDPVYWQPLGGSQVGWVYFYQGGRLDSATGQYLFRHRDESPTLGCWLEQDPKGYVDGLNLYEDEGDNPPNRRDPAGTQMIRIITPPGTRWTPGRLGMTCSFVTGRCVPARSGVLSRCTELVQIATGRVLFCWTVRVGPPIYRGDPFPTLIYPLNH